MQFARGYVGDVGGEYNGVKSGQNLKDDRPASELLNEAVALAKKSDVVIFVGGLNKSDYQDSEGMTEKDWDYHTIRISLSLHWQKPIKILL